MNKLISIAFLFTLSTTPACIADETDTLDETQVRQDPNGPDQERELPDGCHPLKNGDLDCDIPEE